MSAHKAMLVAVGVLTWLVGSQAGAQEAAAAQIPDVDGQQVEIQSRHCEEHVSSEALGAAVSLELRSADELTLRYLDVSQPQILLFCMEEWIQVSLRDDAIVSVARVRLDRLGLVRFIALAVVESLSARAVERAQKRAAESPAEPEAPEPPASPLTASHKHEGFWLRLNYVGRLQLGEGWLRFGADLGVGIAPDPHWTVEFDLGMELGQSEHPPGEIFLVGGGLAARTLLGSELGEHARLDGGVGLRGGLASWAGTPADASTTQGASGLGAWLGAAVTARLTWWMVPDLGLELGVEGGLLIVDSNATADGRRITSLGPGFVGVSVGLAWRAIEAEPQASEAGP